MSSHRQDRLEIEKQNQQLLLEQLENWDRSSFYLSALTAN